MNKYIQQFLDQDKGYLTQHVCKTIAKEKLALPNPDFVDQVFMNSDRSNQVLNSLTRLRNHGRLANTGYISILPVDQGVEHSAGASFAPNPDYFDPENLVRLAIEGGCNGIASTYGVLSSVARKYAHKIPFIVKLNHNELLTYPNKFDQIYFAEVEQALDMGAVAVGATIYFGSAESSRQIEETSAAFARAHELGLATILWCYLRNPSFKADKDYHTSADLTGQANHLGATLGADIVKQKLPTNNGGFKALPKFGKTHDKVYSELRMENFEGLSAFTTFVIISWHIHHLQHRIALFAR